MLTEKEAHEDRGAVSAVPPVETAPPVMVRVESSNIRAVGYEPTSRQLAVEFTSGATYLYADVPPETFEALLAAPSKGAFFAACVKGRHAFRKLSPRKL